MPASGYRKFTKSRQDEYLRAISEDGASRASAAKASGVVITTVNVYIRDHPEFAERRDCAEMERNGQVEDSLFQAAVSGNVTACLAFLYSRDPEMWSDMRNVRLSGPDGGPIELAAVAQQAREHLVSKLDAIAAAREDKP